MLVLSQFEILNGCCTSQASGQVLYKCIAVGSAAKIRKEIENILIGNISKNYDYDPNDGGEQLNKKYLLYLINIIINNGGMKTGCGAGCHTIFDVSSVGDGEILLHRDGNYLDLDKILLEDWIFECEDDGYLEYVNKELKRFKRRYGW